jgi:hypothetical protein
MSHFFVYIIESPSAPDLYHRRSEGQVLLEALRLNQISSVARCAISRVAFDAALRVGLTEELTGFQGMTPIIHISCHGNSEGLQLSNGDFISWTELSDLLRPINEALNNQLVLSMSCCEGYAGIRMAMTLDNTADPYFCLIGTPDKPTWADTCVAFTCLYHRINKGAHISDAVDAMRSASGVDTFFVEWAENSKRGYLEYHHKQLDTTTVTTELTAVADAQPPTEIAEQSLLEKGNGLTSPSS